MTLPKNPTQPSVPGQGLITVNVPATTPGGASGTPGQWTEGVSPNDPAAYYVQGTHVATGAIFQTFLYQGDAYIYDGSTMPAASGDAVSVDLAKAIAASPAFRDVHAYRLYRNAAAIYTP